MSMLGVAGQLTPGLQGAPISVLDTTLAAINTSPYFTASMMLLLNLGGRFLGLELSKNQEQFFMHPYVRRFLIFVVLFVATRNIAIAFWMTILIILIIGYFFNENSSLCLFKGGIMGSACSVKENFTSGSTGAHPIPGIPNGISSNGNQSANNLLSSEEEMVLKILLDKKQKLQQQQQGQEGKEVKEKESTESKISKYFSNMKLLNIFN
jgi:hypothetical protein